MTDQAVDAQAKADAPSGGEKRPYGELVARFGLSESHRLILEAVPAGARVLDIGCASGYLAAELTRKSCKVVGFDQDRVSAELARPHCSEVVVGDLEREEDRRSLPGGQDAVLFGDVLEHLRDPLSVLRWARTRLAPGGRVVVSLPNIGIWSARRAVALGRFRYADSGIFDRTHLRFFTRTTAHELVEQAGYSIQTERFAPTELPLEAVGQRLLGPDAMDRLRWTAARKRPTVFALQFVLTLTVRARST